MLNGCGHTIYGAYLQTPQRNGAALFGCIDGGVVADVHLEQAYFAADRKAGGISACVHGDGSIISGCSFSGVLQANRGAGGMAALAAGGQIAACSAQGRVSCPDSAGGMIGLRLVHTISSAAVGTMPSLKAERTAHQ